MIRVKLLIEYDGSEYVGWQSQKNGRSVQGEIEYALRKIFNRKLRLYVAGRTDAGVHAFGQVAHFDLENTTIDQKRIFKAINFFLKERKNKITILNSEFMKENFHSRFSVKKKIYLYKIHNRETVSHLLTKRVWHFPQKVDINKIKKGSKILIGKYDFNAFRSSNCQAKTSIRTIDEIKVKKEKECIEFRVCGKSFMHNQVRIIVGTLLKIGIKQIDENNLKEILMSKDRRNAGPTAPAYGLYLEKIIY
jgi:tRNA pseudouridine38-40 synthase